MDSEPQYASTSKGTPSEYSNFFLKKSKKSTKIFNEILSSKWKEVFDNSIDNSLFHSYANTIIRTPKSEDNIRCKISSSTNLYRSKSLTCHSHVYGFESLKLILPEQVNHFPSNDDLEKELKNTIFLDNDNSETSTVLNTNQVNLELKQPKLTIVPTSKSESKKSVYLKCQNDKSKPPKHNNSTNASVPSKKITNLPPTNCKRVLQSKPAKLSLPEKCKVLSKANSIDMFDSSKPSKISGQFKPKEMSIRTPKRNSVNKKIFPKLKSDTNSPTRNEQINTDTSKIFSKTKIYNMEISLLNSYITQLEETLEEWHNSKEDTKQEKLEEFSRSRSNIDSGTNNKECTQTIIEEELTQEELTIISEKKINDSVCSSENKEEPSPTIVSPELKSTKPKISQYTSINGKINSELSKELLQKPTSSKLKIKPCSPNKKNSLDLAQQFQKYKVTALTRSRSVEPSSKSNSSSRQIILKNRAKKVKQLHDNITMKSSLYITKGRYDANLQNFIQMVNHAKEHNKTFTVCDNLTIRNSLLRRGWLEKIHHKETYLKSLEKISIDTLTSVGSAKYCTLRKVITSKLLEGHPVDFYWSYSQVPLRNNDQMVANRYPNGGLYLCANKAVLCKSLQETHWYTIEGSSELLYPRTYNLADPDGFGSFLEDYRITASISLLQWVIQRHSAKQTVISRQGGVSISVLNFALVQCEYYLRCRQNKDIDDCDFYSSDREWAVFLDRVGKLLYNWEHFKEFRDMSQGRMVALCTGMLQRIKPLRPSIQIDGINNLWILKPHNASCGTGIVLCKHLRDVFKQVQLNKKQQYVAQKYIERPFLIYKTKFDIRQWILVASIPQISIWMYKECYLRFSSQIYNLRSLHESIHLTNNSVQRKYNNVKRDASLPEQNMWHSDRFQKHLMRNGHGNAWPTIYKKMKQAILGLFLMCRDRMVDRKNSFELCGVDFMLSEDLKPYLIEVNNRPALHSSTNVTAKMCPDVLEDVIRVVIDYARNKRASTGKFELIYWDKNNNINTPLSDTTLNSLRLEGQSLFSQDINSNFKVMPKLQPKETFEKLLRLVEEQQRNLNAACVLQEQNNFDELII